MEEIREIAVTKLGELQKIKPKPYTALELRGRKPMLGRVERQERKAYHQRVQKQKIKLKKDISDIDVYQTSVAARKDYLVNLPKKNGVILMQLNSTIPTVLPAPTIVFGKKPMLKETRLQRHKRRGRF